MVKREGKLNRLKNLIYVRPLLDDTAPLEIDVGDIWQDLEQKVGSSLFMNYYSQRSLMNLFEKAGIVKRLSHLGLSNLNIVVDRRDPFEHRMRLYAGERAHDTLLMELVVKEGVFRPKQQYVDGFTFDDLHMLMIEWLNLQNPRGTFTDERPKLPGQKYPGLGILKNLEGVMLEFCEKLNFEGILDIPEHYHGALMYSPKFFFFNPQMQGKLRAMMRDLSQFPLEQVSHAVELGCVINRGRGEFERWSPGEQILPVSERFVSYFSSTAYGEIVSKVEQRNSFAIDWLKLRDKLSTQKDI
jgi:hypothetical protein